MRRTRRQVVKLVRIRLQIVKLNHRSGWLHQPPMRRRKLPFSPKLQVGLPCRAPLQIPSRAVGKMRHRFKNQLVPLRPHAPDRVEVVVPVPFAEHGVPPAIHRPIQQPPKTHPLPFRRNRGVGQVEPCRRQVHLRNQLLPHNTSGLARTSANQRHIDPLVVARPLRPRKRHAVVPAEEYDRILRQAPLLQQLQDLPTFGVHPRDEIGIHPQVFANLRSVRQKLRHPDLRPIMRRIKRLAHIRPRRVRKSNMQKKWPIRRPLIKKLRERSRLLRPIEIKPPIKLVPLMNLPKPTGIVAA